MTNEEVKRLKCGDTVLCRFYHDSARKNYSDEKCHIRHIFTHKEDENVVMVVVGIDKNIAGNMFPILPEQVLFLL